MRGKFLSSFHPGSLLFYFFICVFMAAVYTHPLYLAALFIVNLALIISLKGLRPWRTYMRFSLMMTIFIVLMNVMASRAGATILWEGPIIPTMGKFTISWEALMFGLTMALKLSLILSIFCVLEMVLPADKTFSFFNKIAPKFSLIFILTALMIPQLKRRLGDITVVMQARGAKLTACGLVEKTTAYSPLLKIILVSSLEDSWQTAEALYARAFGVGPRTPYSKNIWRRRDTLLSFGTAVSLAIFCTGLFQPKGFLSFYPVIQTTVYAHEMVWILGAAWSVLFLIFLNEMRNRWHSLELII